MPPATTRSKTDARLSRPEQVARKIKDWVVEQRMRPGDRLPTEAEMIADFAMSKGTIREAMRILEAQGLVKSRTGPGGGTFVHAVSTERARALLSNYFYFRDLTIADVYQMRRTLEPELVGALAGRLPPEVLDALEAVTDRYARPAQTLEEERDQHVASLEFHALLAAQADNPLQGFVIGFTVQLLTGITLERQLYEPPNERLRASGHDYHMRLLAALREGDAGAARAIMKAHMENAWSLMGDQEAMAAGRFLPE
ncbi:FadR/GntR family transcriptional regulator [Poseidonocella sp. HB161398]|uniref:FadR/GntR family transcriptional regulator n=1 Tax=Poseidonocella sp. HB161398 TaxID=2320855 RepID=UPI00210633C6|nr:FCD domain-containing protein [Poseidonocella sp. HB161398]